VAIYKERLNALKMGSAEAAAQKAWLSIQEEAKGKLSAGMAKRLTDLLAAFEKAHGQTKFHKGLAEQIAGIKTRIEDSLGYTKWPFDEKEAKRRQRATADALRVKVEQDIDLGNGVKMTFVLIPAGEFLMGSPPTTSPEQLEKLFGKDPYTDYTREFPQHRVRISKPLWLGKTEVTQEQWQGVMGNNPSKLRDGPQNPVENVSWHDCQQFLQKLNGELKKTFRLPTEAEWEYACRAGAATHFYFGDRATNLGEYAWCKGKSGPSTQPVRKKKPNAWGLHDMAGNVSEWCEDWFGPYEKGDQTDPRGPGPGAGRVVRGGSFYTAPTNLLSANRDRGIPGERNSHFGFRVVLAAEPT
jgi:formylglycine-generating enzyme required for sulfatase activity